jgi:hypothetical protein
MKSFRPLLHHSMSKLPKIGSCATALLCTIALAACGFTAPTGATPTSAPAVNASSTLAPGATFTPANTPTTATATPPATATSSLPFTATLAALPTPEATPGISAVSGCGAYTITQDVTSVLDTGRVTRVSISDATGQPLKQVALDTSQGGMVGISQVRCGDLTGDGVPTLMLETYTGGANCCFVYDLYALTATLPSLLHWEARKGGIQTFALLSGKPPYQIVGVDDRLSDLDLLPMYATPELPVVFTLRDGQYVRATKDFPQVLRENLQDVQQAIPTCDQDEICERSQAVRAYALGYWLGEESATLADLKAALSPAVYTWLEGVRDKVTQALAE